MTARASALALLVALNAAGAQSTREGRVDAGAAQIPQTGRATHDVAGVFGFSWREGPPLFATLLSAAVTQTGDSTTAAQAGLAAAWRATDRSAWETESGITVAAVRGSILSRGGSFSGFLRERLALDAGGVWAGAAYGGTSRDNLASHSTALDIGAWWRSGDFEATASVGRVRSEDFSLLEAAGGFLPNGAAADDLTDVATELRYEPGAPLLDAAGAPGTGARPPGGSQSSLY